MELYLHPSMRLRGTYCSFPEAHFTCSCALSLSVRGAVVVFLDRWSAA